MKRNKKIVNIIKKTIQDVYSNGYLDHKKAYNYIKLFKSLLQDQAIQYLAVFKKTLEARINAQTLIIESAVKLSDQEAGQITNLLKKDFVIAQTEFKLNPLLLGGIKVKIADTVLDDSTAAKIEQVRGTIIST